MDRLTRQELEVSGKGEIGPGGWLRLGHRVSVGPRTDCASEPHRATWLGRKVTFFFPAPDVRTTVLVHMCALWLLLHIVPSILG